MSKKEKVEIEVKVDMAKPGTDETVVLNVATPSEAKGSDASEAAEVADSEVEVSEEVVAPADTSEESETEDSATEVVEEVLPLTATLTFGEEVVKLEVTENFQLDLRQACKDKDSRFDEFEVDGELSAVNLRLLLNALK